MKNNTDSLRILFEDFESLLWNSSLKEQKEYLIRMGNLARKLQMNINQKSTNLEKPKPRIL